MVRRCLDPVEKDLTKEGSHLIALIQTEDIAKKILTAMHLPADIPALHPARSPPRQTGGADRWVN